MNMIDLVNLIRIILIVTGIATTFFGRGSRLINAMVGMSLITASSLVGWLIQFADSYAPPTIIEIVGLISIGIMLVAAIYRWFQLRREE